MPVRADDGGTTYGPSWYDVATYAATITGTTGWKVAWDAHVETFTGKVRTYWKVNAFRPPYTSGTGTPLITRGDFFPTPNCATVPALLHRLLAQVDADLATQREVGPLSELPLFAPAVKRSE